MSAAPTSSWPSCATRRDQMARVLDVFSDPQHAELIRTEVKLADQAYNTMDFGKDNDAELDNYHTRRGYPEHLSTLGYAEDEPLWDGRTVNNAARIAAINRKCPLTPFLAHALHQAVAVTSEDRNNSNNFDQGPFFVGENPGLVVCAGDYETTTVFFDVTDVNNICYGFLAPPRVFARSLATNVHNFGTPDSGRFPGPVVSG
ncbi:hypothetical protein Sste5346_008278 [Sporothrix stenoceras]|uniref:Uncharacterized protein n=1 Tax=Sporothrix stenoceras TaxID=5173 RepID=A0ABR3YSY4_9PEZI